MDEMRKLLAARKQLQDDVIGYAIKHLHDILTNSDQEVIDHTCSQLKCSEFELFDALHCVAGEYDVQLDDAEE